MKKIISPRLTATGVIEEEQKIKVKNFDDGEAAIYFRAFLTEKGMANTLGTTIVKKGRYGELQYPTLYGVPIKVRFCLWAAQKDTETGKAVFWIGEKNSAGYTQDQVDYGIIVGDRIVRTDVMYHALIVTTRTFRIGTSLKDQPFVEYLLVPIEDIIEICKQTQQGWIDIRKSHREQYAFDRIIGRLRSTGG